MREIEELSERKFSFVVVNFLQISTTITQKRLQLEVSCFNFKRFAFHDCCLFPRSADALKAQSANVNTQCQVSRHKFALKVVAMMRNSIEKHFSYQHK